MSTGKNLKNLGMALKLNEYISSGCNKNDEVKHSSKGRMTIGNEGKKMKNTKIRLRTKIKELNVYKLGRLSTFNLRILKIDTQSCVFSGKAF